MEKREDGWYLATNLYDFMPQVPTGLPVDTEMLGMAFEPEQRFENPDGTALKIDTDYWGETRDTATFAGPFNSASSAGRRLF